jgi:hypothetical protein
MGLGFGREISVRLSVRVSELVERPKSHTEIRTESVASCREGKSEYIE